MFCFLFMRRLFQTVIFMTRVVYFYNVRQSLSLSFWSGAFFSPSCLLSGPISKPLQGCSKWSLNVLSWSVTVKSHFRKFWQIYLAVCKVEVLSILCMFKCVLWTFTGWKFSKRYSSVPYQNVVYLGVSLIHYFKRFESIG